MPNPPTHDRDALLAARHGEHDAGRWLVERHAASMVRTAWSVLGRSGGADAEDSVQEAFVTALTTDALPRGEEIGAWLRAITVRKALDGVRRVARRREQPIGEVVDAECPVAADGGPAGVVDAVTVRRVLATLTPTDRAILVLADVEGHSMREVARALGLTQVAVKLRASRARRRLAQRLRKAQPWAKGDQAPAREGGRP